MELVLAYFEDAQRIRTPFTIQDKKLEIPAVLQSVDEDAGTATFTLSGSFPGGKGSKVEMVFNMENTRLGGRGQVTESRSNTLVVTLPDELELMERRKQPRARINPKEGATVTALTGLFDGIGVNGVLESISESGCRLRVEKAMNNRDEKRLPLGTALLSPGQPLMLVKLNKVPRCPSVMEMSGKLAYLTDTSGGLAMAIIFDKPRVDFAGAIRSLVSSRASAIPTSVPPKARRKPPTADSSLAADPNERASRPREEEPVSYERSAPPRHEPPKPEPAPEAPAPEPPEESAHTPEPPRNAALMRLKKRTRTVVAMTSATYGELLKGFLLDEGYGRVLIVANQHELEEALLHCGSGLVLIDNGAPVLETFELVAQFHEYMSDLPPFILAAEDVSRALVLAAHRSGVSQLLVKPYPMDETLSALLEQQMGL